MLGGLSSGQPQVGNTKYQHVKLLVCSKLFVLLLKGFVINRLLGKWKQPENILL